MPNGLKKINLKLLAAGHFIFHSMNYGFDYILYPFVIYQLGPLGGGMVMTFLSVFLNLGVLFLYNFLERDLLGIEAAKELAENFFKEEEFIVKKSWRKHGKKIMSWLFYKNKIGHFLFLSIQFDPIITTIYMKPGYHMYNGFSKRDWRIFWGSTIVSNAWWTGIAFLAVVSLEGIISRFF